jgi:retron-type reverse transcriptase
LGKGTHKALARFRAFARKASRNHTKTLWVLQCDVRKFFASIDHATLLGILRRSIADQDVLWLLGRIIESFSSIRLGVGLPLGNLTSQLFVNIYMNEFDHFVKHCLKARRYVRYADDFVILSWDRDWLEGLLPAIKEFLCDRLRLELHPDKVKLQTLASGVDFLGWVHFSSHCVLRTTTRCRMLRRIKENTAPETLQSYLGLLTHGNTFKLRQEVLS